MAPDQTATQAGFTLLEVLVSVVLILATVTSFSLTVRQVMDVDKRVERSLRLKSAFDTALDDISTQLRSGAKPQLTKSGSWQGISYHWQVQPKEILRGLPAGMAQGGVAFPDIILYRVELKLEGANKGQQYIFEDFGWNLN